MLCNLGCNVPLRECPAGCPFRGNAEAIMKLFSRKQMPKIRSRAAFSLVEVMVAVLLISTVFIAIFSSMTMALTVTQLSRENLRATQIMLDKMEGVRLYSWTQLNDTNFLQSSFTNWFYDTNNVGLVSAQGNGVKYTGTVNVTAWPYATGYATNMRQVMVTVGWASQANGSGIGSLTHSRSMSTFVSQTGMQNYVYNN
jgi:Tfp pilus assembly protein PilV